MIMQSTEGIVNDKAVFFGDKIKRIHNLISLDEDCELISMVMLDKKYIFTFRDKKTKSIHLQIENFKFQGKEIN